MVRRNVFSVDRSSEVGEKLFSVSTKKTLKEQAGQFILVLLLLTIMYTLTNHLLLMTLFKRKEGICCPFALHSIYDTKGHSSDDSLFFAVCFWASCDKTWNRYTTKTPGRRGKEENEKGKSSSVALVKDMNDALNDNLKGCTRKLFQFCVLSFFFRKKKGPEMTARGLVDVIALMTMIKKARSEKCGVEKTRKPEKCFWKINSLYFIIWEETTADKDGKKVCKAGVKNVKH